MTKNMILAHQQIYERNADLLSSVRSTSVDAKGSALDELQELT